MKNLPIITHFDKARLHVCASVQYNTTGQWLDIWHPADRTLTGAPVLLFVPGGAWLVGRRRGQSHELMSHLVDQGWICVAIDYRTAPLHRWPAPFIDVKTALNWTQDHIVEFGGDQNFIAVAGASAGAHMASLAGLTFDRAPFANPPFHDYAPKAVVSLYGVYDWTFRGSIYHEGFVRLLEQVVVGKSQRKHPEIFRDASPVHQVRADAPPFLILHGTSDWLTPISGARRFNEKLAAVSQDSVEYHEIRGGQHAFDLVNSEQAKEAITMIDKFLTNVRRQDQAVA